MSYIEGIQMSTQAIIQKEETSKTLKIAIVGARSSKWTKEQEKTMKMVIEHILKSLKVGQVVSFDNDGELLTSGKNIHYTELGYTPEVVVVSGHCPVGEVCWFCLDCNCFIQDEHIINHATQNSNGMIRVYDQGGVDTEVEIACAKLEIKTEIYPAPAKQWEDKIENQYVHLGTFVNNRLQGYRSRNIQIAETCNILFDLEPKGSCKYCGGVDYKTCPECNGRGMISNARCDYHFDCSKCNKTGKLVCSKCEGDGSYSGGTFTLKEARKRGKETHKVIIE